MIPLDFQPAKPSFHTDSIAPGEASWLPEGSATNIAIVIHQDRMLKGWYTYEIPIVS